MDAIKKVALIGAGAIGCYFIDCFDGIDTFEFTVIAEGERLERLKEEGVKVNGHIIKPQVKTPKDAGPQDLILISTKYMGLDDAISYLPEMMKEDTLVLSLLNGVDSEEKVAKAIGFEHIIYSFMRVSSERRNGEVNYRTTPTMGVMFGLSKDQNKEPALSGINRLCLFFDGTRVKYKVIDDILGAIWYKFASNIANNLPQAVLGTPAKLYTTKEGIFLNNMLWQEVRNVAKAKGIDIPKEACIWQSNEARYSTLQDIDAKRKTEIDMFTGVLIKMAEDVDVDVPCCIVVHNMIKALELKNEGYYES